VTREAIARLLDEAYTGYERRSRTEIQRRATAAELAAADMARVDALPEGEYTQDEAAEALGIDPNPIEGGTPAMGTPTTTRTAAMLQAYPGPTGNADPAALARAIDECLACFQACTACADACLSEEELADLIMCIRLNQDCADICAATAQVLSRPSGFDRGGTMTLVRACVEACRACEAECQRHAGMHEHCAICAEACRRCAEACAALTGSAAP
jgi:hypothetical protein